MTPPIKDGLGSPFRICRYGILLLLELVNSYRYFYACTFFCTFTIVFGSDFPCCFASAGFAWVFLLVEPVEGISGMDINYGVRVRVRVCVCCGVVCRTSTNRFQRYSDGLARICMGLGAKVSEYF